MGTDAEDLELEVKPSQEEVKKGEKAEKKLEPKEEKETTAALDVEVEVKPAQVEIKERKKSLPEKEKEVKVEAEVKQVEKEKGKHTLVEVQKKKPVHIEVKTDDLPQGKSKPSDKQLSENKKESESYKATKEEIEDSLLFIKNKLKDQPTKEQENVFQDQDYDEVNTEESYVEGSPIQNPNTAAKSFATEC